MAVLSKPELLNQISDAILDNGWNLWYASTAHPFRFIVSKNNELHKIIVYIYNISHGGNTRDPEEYRIQIKLRDEKLEFDDGWKTLILGWWDEGKVFAGFDAPKHPYPKYSSSLQIRLPTLRNAEINGLSVSQKENDEIAVAFTSDLFMTYVSELNKVHDLASTEADIQILSEIVQKSDEESLDAGILIEKVTKPRREVVRSIHTKLRESNFRKRVLVAYENRCAFCGVQLGLVEAAHVLPVSYESSTDETSNGIALCVLHHKAFDSSFITFDTDYKITHNKHKAEHFRQNKLDGGMERFLADIRTHISLPPSIKDRPNREYVETANKIRGWK
jgi:putative restriction endonuclease